MCPDVKNPAGTPHTPSASGEWLHETADARCVWIPVAWDYGRLVRPDTGCMATGRPLLSDRGFSLLIIPQRSVHTASVPIPHTTQLIPYIYPLIFLF